VKLTVHYCSAAIIHYKPERGDCSIVDPDKIYLCDSGAQFLDGTTDSTRTLHYGKATDEEKEAYTLVLKGNIALDRAVFPKGTTGYALDCLARQHLWVRTFQIPPPRHNKLTR
jgi:Xaa-Pro aminopeptidase